MNPAALFAHVFEPSPASSPSTTTTDLRRRCLTAPNNTSLEDNRNSINPAATPSPGLPAAPRRSLHESD